MGSYCVKLTTLMLNKQILIFCCTAGFSKYLACADIFDFLANAEIF